MTPGTANLDPDEIYLLINGKIFGGWLEVRVTRSIEAICGSFEVSYTDVWEPDMLPWDINRGDSVQVFIGPDLVMTGWVDATDPEISFDQHSLKVVGRDKTCDIVDCSATNRPGEWRNKSLESIMGDICSPYGVKVIAYADTGGAVKLFRLQPGEKAFDALERLAKARQLMLSGSPDGIIHLKQFEPEALGITLQEGVNILTAHVHDSDEMRYSDYVCEGQGSGQSKQAHTVHQTAKDSEVKRFRQLTILAEDNADEGYGSNRAEWESRVRGARAFSADVTVQGWRMPDGRLWKADTTLVCNILSCRLNEELMINTVEYLRSNEGTSTKLTLRKPEYTWKYKKNKKVKSLVRNK